MTYGARTTGSGGGRRARLRWAVLPATVAIAGGAMAFAAHPAAAATLTVHIHPGQSIQAAIDAATGPETIVVDPGTYNEALFIYKNGITLKGGGQAPSQVVVTPSSQTVPNICSQIFGLSGICVANPEALVKHTTIENLTVAGWPAQGIFAIGNRSLTVRDDNLNNNSDYGVFALQSSGVTFAGNEATGSGEAGFYVGDSPAANVTETNNVSTNSQFGFFFRHSHGATFTGNTATGNCIGFMLLDDGQSGGDGNATLTDNQASANDKFCPAVSEGPESHPPLSGTGIALVGAVHTLVQINNVYNNVGTPPGGSATTSQPVSPISGGIVVVSSQPLSGGAAASNDTVRNNDLSGNVPADIVWDGSGTGNSFTGNACHTSIPGGFC